MANKQTPSGTQNDPIWARTSVLCNGQIVYKVKAKTELEPRADPTDPRNKYKPVKDTAENLHALNSLQLSRYNSLGGYEVTRPLLHVWECLPRQVKRRIGLGGDTGWSQELFTSNRPDFKNLIVPQISKTIHANGQVEYAELLQEIRSSQYFLWPIEALQGVWMGVILYLEKGSIVNPAKAANPNNPKVPHRLRSKSYNRIRGWDVVFPPRDPASLVLRDRVIRRLRRILRHGDLRIRWQTERHIWVPEQPDNFSSGIRVFHALKEQMHRVTELFCREAGHRNWFWKRHSGWLNIDEVRSEMQGRAAQKCIADLDYYARIAVEGVRPELGVKVKVNAIDIRPRRKGKVAYAPGQNDGNFCVASTGWPAVVDEVGEETTEDDENAKGGFESGSSQGSECEDSESGSDSDSDSESNGSDSDGNGGNEDGGQGGPSQGKEGTGKGKEKEGANKGKGKEAASKGKGKEGASKSKAPPASSPGQGSGSNPQTSSSPGIAVKGYSLPTPSKAAPSFIPGDNISSSTTNPSSIPAHPPSSHIKIPKLGNLFQPLPQSSSQAQNPQVQNPQAQNPQTPSKVPPIIPSADLSSSTTNPSSIPAGTPPKPPYKPYPGGMLYPKPPKNAPASQAPSGAAAAATGIFSITSSPPIIMPVAPAGANNSSSSQTLPTGSSPAGNTTMGTGGTGADPPSSNPAGNAPDGADSDTDSTGTSESSEVWIPNPLGGVTVVKTGSGTAPGSGSAAAAAAVSSNPPSGGPSSSNPPSGAAVSSSPAGKKTASGTAGVPAAAAPDDAEGVVSSDESVVGIGPNKTIPEPSAKAQLPPGSPQYISDSTSSFVSNDESQVGVGPPGYHDGPGSSSESDDESSSSDDEGPQNKGKGKGKGKGKKKKGKGKGKGKGKVSTPKTPDNPKKRVLEEEVDESSGKKYPPRRLRTSNFVRTEEDMERLDQELYQILSSPSKKQKV
ncbi:hypothetical protein F4775DRAFT_606959 [Biscogniauxia sp. FL1348]|nr:hypothetical protein F4775DRAFT_606959 [Biscogniauxia sp. FL1348]